MTGDKLDVLALFGTRPELIKLAPVLKLLGADDRFQLIVVSTSQHREMIDGLPPNLKCPGSKRPASP